MRTMILAATLPIAALATGCMHHSDGDSGASGGRYAAGHFRAEAKLATSAGVDAGTATIQQVDGGLRLIVSVQGIAPGPHGVHVHTLGACDAPDFTTAGGHWNPGAMQHGMQNPAGPHAGDAPNLVADANGRGRFETMLPAGATWDALLDEDGAAIVIHAGPDDYRTDPSGNSGGRIACGVFAAL